MLMLYLFFILFHGNIFADNQDHGKNICAMEGTKKLCIQRDVIGMRGEDVILPCRFYHNEGKKIKELSLVLFKYRKPSTKTLLFNSSSKYIHGSFNGRIQTLGSTSDGDGSVRIRDLKMEDEGMYMCWFQFYEMVNWSKRKWRHAKFKAGRGYRTRLQVDVRPAILHIWMTQENSSSTIQLECKGEGKPSPSIIWRNPHGHLVETSIVHKNPRISSVVSVMNITGEDPPGNYSCTLENKHGMEQKFVTYKGSEGKTGARAQKAMVGWLMALSLFFIFVFAFGFYIYRNKENITQGIYRNTEASQNQNHEEDEITYAIIAVHPHRVNPPPEHSAHRCIYAVIKS
uniref:butyrophilin subfamily 1 member A1-like isoform X1 n=2 Tax=Myxine glutinosa TaxID=7769 RepID=UPI00358E7B96